jgi:hypothetical protein
MLAESKGCRYPQYETLQGDLGSQGIHDGSRYCRRNGAGRLAVPNEIQPASRIRAMTTSTAKRNKPAGD